MATKRWSLPSSVLTSAISNVEEADRVCLELLLGLLLAVDLWQPTDAVALIAAMQRGSRQMGDGGLQRVEAIVERQQGMLAESDGDGFFVLSEDGRSNLRGFYRGIIIDAAVLDFRNVVVIEIVL